MNSVIKQPYRRRAEQRNTGSVNAEASVQRFLHLEGDDQLLSQNSAAVSVLFVLRWENDFKPDLGSIDKVEVAQCATAQ